MRPITIFDKSFLQSLSVDESVWHDTFFESVITPLFYVETLADLQKQVKPGRTPEQEVAIIAEKFPEVHSVPCVNSHDSATGDLLAGMPDPACAHCGAPWQSKGFEQQLADAIRGPVITASGKSENRRGKYPSTLTLSV